MNDLKCISLNDFRCLEAIDFAQITAVSSCRCEVSDSERIMKIGTGIWELWTFAISACCSGGILFTFGMIIVNSQRKLSPKFEENRTIPVATGIFTRFFVIEFRSRVSHLLETRREICRTSCCHRNVD